MTPAGMFAMAYATALRRDYGVMLCACRFCARRYSTYWLGLSGAAWYFGRDWRGSGLAR